jgi:hypothetical protein
MPWCCQFSEDRRSTQALAVALDFLATPRGRKLAQPDGRELFGESLGAAPLVTAPQLGCSFVPPPICAPKNSRDMRQVFSSLLGIASKGSAFLGPS